MDYKKSPQRLEAPINRVLNALEEFDCEPKQSGQGWTAKCPAHDDHNPSLSFAEGNDGRVLLNCFTGCKCADICSAVGLTEADLFDQSTVTTSLVVDTTHSKTNGKPGTTYDTAGEAIAAYERNLGKPSNVYTYENNKSEPVGLILRWDKPDEPEGKIIRPVSKQDGKWILGGMPEPRPLYRLSELADAKRVYITEGEKAADAAVLEKQEVRFLFMDSYDQQRIGNELLIDAANSFRAAADFECDNWPTPTKL